MKTPRIVVAGAGAIAERFHLPALARRPEVMRRAVLVDRNLARASALAAQFGAASAVASLDEALPGADGVLVLTPARLHVEMTRAALQAGAHVLCEKPLAPSAAEVDAIAAAEREAGRRVAVNNTRRLVPAFRLVHDLVREGAVGEVRAIELTMGEPFDWPSAGDGYFGIKAGGRGVLADIGAHLVDLAAWWAAAPLELQAYEDDAAGGTEATADVRFRAGRAEAHVRLSWLSKLPNRYQVTGSTGTLGGAMYDATTVELSRGGRVERRRAAGPATFPEQAAALIDNFLAVITDGATPLVGTSDVRASIALIDACYAARRPMAQPWHDVWERLAHV